MRLASTPNARSQAVQTAMQHTKPGTEELIAKMTLEIPAIA